MKLLSALIPFLFAFMQVYGQQIPNLPIPIGAANAEVWNSSIYNFGGSNNWSGSVVYPRIYKFNGTSWNYHDTIPDNNLWDVETVLAGDKVYLLGGWPNGPSLNRRYDLTNSSWTYLSESPNLSQDWGLTSEEYMGNIYLFNSSGNVYAYNIATDTWVTRTSNTSLGSWDMSSILYQGEIYILGWNNLAFYKYSPATDQWTQLADSPYQVGACAFGIINNLIYCIGGNANGSTSASYKSVIVYDIYTNSWNTDEIELSSKRHWMSTAEYQGGLYVVGGIDSLAQAVDIVEEIVPQGTVGIPEQRVINKEFTLEQNKPNPIVDNSIISFAIPEKSMVKLTITDIQGKEIMSLLNSEMTAGTYNVNIEANKFMPGVYIYKLEAGVYQRSRKFLVK
ncbi:MAG: T9SS type A sorting domain-containing protein [Bacteroidales bacterium]|nr:T9SS type A sorting domain-containing protein [Bacteroidales bacterium]